MTREEAVKYIRYCMCEGRLVGNTKPIIDEKWQAGAMAIKALEQEPKTGHWIVTKDCEGKTRKCTCDKCGYETGEYTWHNPNYCANCGSYNGGGTKMESEGEDS